MARRQSQASKLNPNYSLDERESSPLRQILAGGPSFVRMRESVEGGSTSSPRTGRYPLTTNGKELGHNERSDLHAVNGRGMFRSPLAAEGRAPILELFGVESIFHACPL